jgi:predicted aspartyl protease
METATVGKVVVPARIENLFDVEREKEGLLSEDQIRRLDCAEALVDTGATFLSMPKSLIDQLGLRLLETRQAKTTAGVRTFGIYGTARLTVQGRNCEVRATEASEACPVLIGYIPLEMMDFVVDLKNQCLIGNPDHGKEWMIDMYHQELDE